MCRWVLLGLVIPTTNGRIVESFDSSGICEQEYFAAVPNLGKDKNLFGSRVERDDKLLEVGFLVYEERKPAGSKVVALYFEKIFTVWQLIFT